MQKTQVYDGNDESDAEDRGDPSAALEFNGEVYNLYDGPNSIGRKGGQDCDVNLDDDSLSNRHAEIFVHDGIGVVRDLQSTNGTIVRGKKVARNRTVTVNNNDKITFGNAKCTFLIAIGVPAGASGDYDLEDTPPMHNDTANGSNFDFATQVFVPQMPDATEDDDGEYEEPTQIIPVEGTTTIAATTTTVESDYHVDIYGDDTVTGDSPPESPTQIVPASPESPTQIIPVEALIATGTPIEPPGCYAISINSNMDSPVSAAPKGGSDRRNKFMQNLIPDTDSENDDDDEDTDVDEETVIHHPTVTSDASASSLGGVVHSPANVDVTLTSEVADNSDEDSVQSIDLMECQALEDAGEDDYAVEEADHHEEADAGTRGNFMMMDTQYAANTTLTSDTADEEELMVPVAVAPTKPRRVLPSTFQGQHTKKTKEEKPVSSTVTNSDLGLVDTPPASPTWAVRKVLASPAPVVASTTTAAVVVSPKDPPKMSVFPIKPSPIQSPKGGQEPGAESDTDTEEVFSCPSQCSLAAEPLTLKDKKVVQFAQKRDSIIPSPYLPPSPLTGTANPPLPRTSTGSSFPKNACNNTHAGDDDVDNHTAGEGAEADIKHAVSGDKDYGVAPLARPSVTGNASATAKTKERKKVKLAAVEEEEHSTSCDGSSSSSRSSRRTKILVDVVVEDSDGNAPAAQPKRGGRKMKAVGAGAAEEPVRGSKRTLAAQDSPPSSTTTSASNTERCDDKVVGNAKKSKRTAKSSSSTSACSAAVTTTSSASKIIETVHEPKNVTESGDGEAADEEVHVAVASSARASNRRKDANSITTEVVSDAGVNNGVLSGKRTRADLEEKAAVKAASSNAISSESIYTSAPKKKTSRKAADRVVTSPIVVNDEAIQIDNTTRIIFTGIEKEIGLVDKVPDAEIVDDPSQATHVIIGDDLKRTPKLMIALNCGCQFVVRLAWLETCAKKGTVVDATKYIVKDKKKENEWKFSMTKTLSVPRTGYAGNDGVFSGVGFYCTDGVCGVVAPPVADMTAIVTSGGGVWLSKLPTAPGAGYTRICIISHAATGKHITAAVKKTLQNNKIRAGKGIYSPEFIFRGVFSAAVNYEDNLVT